MCDAVCYTEACTYLDRRPPKISLASVTPVLSIISTLTVNLAAQVIIFMWLTHQSWSVADTTINTLGDFTFWLSP